MKLTAILLAILLSSCQTVLPPDTSVSGKSGKVAATVDVSRQTVGDALKKIGVTILQMFVKSATSYALDRAGERFNILTERSGK